MEDDEDFEELFSFAAASPQPTEKASPSTSSEFDMLINNNEECGPTSADNNAAVPSTPGSTSDFDDLFGTPPPQNTAATFSPRKDDEEDPVASFLGSEALDDFQVHDEGTRDFLDWLDDDAGKKDPSSSNGEDKAESNDKDSGKTNNEDDDDFDFDKMLSEHSKPTACAAETTSASAAPSNQESTPLQSMEKKAATEEVVEAKQTKSPPQQQFNDLKDVEPTEEKPPVPITLPPKHSDTIPKLSEANVNVNNAASTQESSSSSSSVNDNDQNVIDDDANDFVMEVAKDEPDADIAVDKPAELSTCIKEENEPNNINQDGKTQLHTRSSVEDELSYQQWSDDVEEENLIAQDMDKSMDRNQTDNSLVEEKKPAFTSLSEAIRSNLSSIDDVRSLFQREVDANGSCCISPVDRVHLWTKVICGKTLEDVDNSSLAESFREWQNNCNIDARCDGENMSMLDALLMKVSLIANESEPHVPTKERLLSLLNFHSQGKGTSIKADPLLPPVAYAILSTGMPIAVASVFLSQIEPKAMPLMRLSTEERFLATKALHADFYLLACYHLPLLMMHLDRNCHGWYWPKKETGGVVIDEKSNENEEEKGEEGTKEKAKTKQFDNNGLIPQSWFVTNFAGERDGACFDHSNLLPLWDNILASGDSSWKFFLAISAFEKRSDMLLMLKGDELRRELEEIVKLKETDSFAGSPDDSVNMVAEWLSMSKSLIECTPSSVIELLRSADDRAVTNAIRLRQIQMEKELQAQADAHEAALKKERDERDAEEKQAEIKARLTAYYRNHNREKLDTIDQILKLFDGRIDVLNQKLKKKYGSGFLPDEAPINQVSNQTKNFFMSVNQSISVTKKHVAASVKDRRKKSARDDTNLKSHVSVALEVSPTEVIPHICSKKQAAGDRAVRSSNADNSLNFYLIDCRPESIAREQGRFPKAIIMSPEKLQDPDELQRLMDMFESLRGAVHICVMGEGFASFPVLYNHPLSEEEQKLLEDDISRTSSCALFFLKKGFPFVSLLRGGFAAAHAFLSRSEEPGLSPIEALVDYDPDSSLFAQLELSRQEHERFKSASNREKTARAVQRIIDNSMTRLTLAEMRINSSAANLSKPENVAKVKHSVSGLTKQMPSVSFGRTPPLFMSKKLAPVDEKGPETKHNATNEGSNDESNATEKTQLRLLPSLNSDASSQRDLSESNHDSSDATPIGPESGDDQKPVAPVTNGELAPSIDVPKETESSERKLPKMNLDSLSNFASRIKSADKKHEVTESPSKQEGPSKISLTLTGLATKVKTSEKAEKTTTKSNDAKATSLSGQSKITASLSSFALKLKTSSTEATADKAISTDNKISTDFNEEGPSKMSTLSTLAAKIKQEKATATNSNDGETSKISAISSFATKVKTSASATGSKAGSEKTNTSVSTTFSSFANRMKSSASGTSNPSREKASIPFSSFSLKKSIVQRNVEGKSPEQVKADQNETTTEDESVALEEMEDEICFD